MLAIKKKFAKVSEKILKQQAQKEKLSTCLCAKCEKHTQDTKLIMSGKTFDELCEEMCNKFDIFSPAAITPEIKRNMEKYLDDVQRKETRPLYVCKACYHKITHPMK